MDYTTAFVELMREYERDRDIARAALDNKRLEVYECIPRVRAIETQLKEISIWLARQILTNGRDSKSLERLKRESDLLVSEKKQLMADSRFGADYFDTPFRCPVCHDTGFVGTARCACLKQRLTEKYYNCSNIGDALLHENFSTFDIGCYSAKVVESEGVSPRLKMKAVLDICKGFADSFINGRPSGNLLFYGKPGLGKTFLCNCLAKEILDRGATVLYMTAPKLFKALEAFRFEAQKEGEPEPLGIVTDVDLLIIDDLGTEISTLVTASGLFEILSERLLLNKPIIISTNLSPTDIMNQYSERIASRLVGDFRMLKFIGDDIRLRNKYRKFMPQE